MESICFSHSYRIPEKLNKHKAPFVFYMKMLKLVLGSPDPIYKKYNANEPGRYAMYCLRPYHADFCINYCRMLGIDVSGINTIVRDCLDNTVLGILDKMLIVTIGAIFTLVNFVTSFFIKHSEKIALIPLELSESIILLSHLKESKSDYLYYFSAYEKDANWIALLLQKNGIVCHKIPSSNPVKNFYPMVIADKFSFTAPFQIYEYPALKHNWTVNEFEIWPNLGSQNLQNSLIEKKGEAPVNSIGIFTRGIWLRKKRGDNFLGVGEDVAEEKMLQYVREYLQNSDDIEKVYLLMHPIEKSNNQQYSESTTYYKNFFNGISVSFIDSDKPSYECFNSFDVGLASVSSVIFERLYCGYKCMMAPIDMKVKLYEDPDLENIIAHSKTEFFDKLEKVIRVKTKDYFSDYHLSKYRLTHKTTVDVESI